MPSKHCPEPPDRQQPDNRRTSPPAHGLHLHEPNHVWAGVVVFVVAAGWALATLASELQGEVLNQLPGFTSFPGDFRTSWPDGRVWDG